MSTTLLCGVTAFQYHRIPPCVLRLIQSQPDLSTRQGRRQVARAGSYLDYLTLPLLVFTDTPASRYRATSVKFQLWKHADTISRTQEIGSYLSVADPLFTLASLARTLDDTRLTMAMYEMCGRFSCIELLPQHASVVLPLFRNSKSNTPDGWRPVLDSKKGSITSQWMRAPLITTDNLLDYAKKLQGTRGARRFERCAQRLKGVLDSPLEVQAVMLLGSPRHIGGEGLQLHLNRKIDITGSAQNLTRIAYAKPDILIERTGSKRGLIVECQGRATHGEDGISGFDSDRINALEHMGYDVMTVTSNQLENEESYREIVKLICHKIGIPFIPKNEHEEQRERAMRQALFSNWTNLGISPLDD